MVCQAIFSSLNSVRRVTPTPVSPSCFSDRGDSFPCNSHPSFFSRVNKSYSRLLLDFSPSDHEALRVKHPAKFARDPSRIVCAAKSSSSQPNSDSGANPNDVVEYNGADESTAVDNAESKQQVLPQEIGRQIAEARKQQITSGQVDSTSTQQFWQGVLEETKMIEWPKFSSVLGTTGVVVTMIIGSSIILLTVNALLSEASDKVFSNPVVAQLWH